MDQLASAFAVLFDFKVQIAMLLILLMAAINLRGVKESGRIFTLPTYFFIAMMLLLIGGGFWQALSGQLGVETDVPGVHTVEVGTLSGAALLFLILRAFSSGQRSSRCGS